MPFEPFTFDESVTDFREPAARVPEGYYLVEFQKFDPTPENIPAGRATGFHAQFRIVAGPDANPNAGLGGQLSEFCTMRDGQFWGLARTLSALGHEDLARQLESSKMNVPSYQAFVNLGLNLDQRVGKGKQAVADIRDVVGAPKPTSRIEHLHKADRWPDLRKATGYVDPNRSNGPVAPVNTATAASVPDLFADLDR